MKKSLFNLLLILISGAAFSQEALFPLKYNSALNEKRIPVAGSRSIVETRDTLCLPFLDDFSNRNIIINETTINCGDTVNYFTSAVYPSDLFWVDSNAFVNLTYPTLPPTYGVVTLDGLNKFGGPYNEASAFDMADFLTSKPIFLGGTPVDSVYLSFYFQPGGFGDFPNENDSLILEFKNSVGEWKHIWHTVNTNGNDPQSFKLQMVAVEDEYFYNGFQFRFRNWAGVNGNNDHWNIDYVFLDEDRTFNDTLFRDVAIIYQPEKYLKRYRQMPWNQFKDHQESELAAEHGVFMYNNFNTIINTSYQYQVNEKYTGEEIIAPTTPISVNLDPFAVALDAFPTFNIPSATPNYEEDSMTINFKYILNPASDINRRNDTMLYEQAFYNYYAYDDGTAEKAYAIIGTGAKLAIKFFANEPDTLKEIYIHWAYVDGNAGNLFFSLMVWDNIDTTLASADENIIFQNDFLTPKYVDSVNGFYVYKLVDFLGNPTPVVVNGAFYVGWLQSQDDFLNVGFDANNDAHDNVYFNVGGSWQKSSLPGAVMIRPQVGGNYSLYSPIINKDPKSIAVNVYPNPASSILNIDIDNNNILDYSIFDHAGRMVSRYTNNNKQINIQNLPSGFYILEMNDFKSGAVYYAKFMKN